MVADDGSEAPAIDGYRAALPEVPFATHGRQDFYAAASGEKVAAVIATGDQRARAKEFLQIDTSNLLLTIGARKP